MVKKACADGSGFGICMHNPQGDKEKNEHIYSLGTYVEVVDFERLDDGFLGITVEGSKVFEIESIETKADELRVGRVQWVKDWSRSAVFSEDKEMLAMTEQLKEIYEKYPEFNNLYQDPRFSDPIWVMFRWLELLPVKATQKQDILKHRNPAEVLNFLASLRSVGMIE
jgi:Lon protease-like protein